MVQMRVHHIPIPAGSALAAFRDEAPHVNAEAVAVTLPAGAAVDPQELARIAMTRPSDTPDALLPLVDAWIKVQRIILRPFGVSPNTMNRKKPQERPVVGNRLGPYQVLAVDGHEVLIGDRDRFIHHRMSFIVTDSKAILGVVLRSLNRGGDFYWAMVRKHQTRILEQTLTRSLQRVLDGQHEQRPKAN
ncbi:DUF2867 domain-containing protein [Micromonospora sp. WMMD956]|jgi:hypothetical protein|uniref:DUF2867 domain-containing protein n=1 Tax=Micromonospora TaxID=1873 RepID=UPI00241608D7|nr:DUF2867 domain-containing protein [Micromonospora sp. WMMD956]MDG4816751.1 DUF2867 domain-containing protein [Micromonospora sp. WMMD956]